jgi:hypothetical protein
MLDDPNLVEVGVRAIEPVAMESDLELIASGLERLRVNRAAWGMLSDSPT